MCQVSPLRKIARSSTICVFNKVTVYIHTPLISHIVKCQHMLRRPAVRTCFEVYSFFPQQLCPFLGGPWAQGLRRLFFRRPASSPASAVFMEASTLTCKALPGRQAGHIPGIPDARQQVTDVGAGPVKVAKARRPQASQALSKS